MDVTFRPKSLLILLIIRRKKQNMKNENEKKLFHGTSPESVETICKKNFDWRLCGKNGTTFGEGSYFALDASYSHKYATVGNDSSQFMFLAKVLAGSYTKGKRAYRTPPPKQPLHPASDLYDSCVDNILNPTIFVTFDIDQCYPEYVIKYSQSIKSIAPRPGLKPTSSLAAVSQLQAPNAHAIRAAASQSSRTSGALTRPPPGISLSYASGLNDTLDIGLSFLSDFASLKSNGHNPYSAPNTSRSQAHRTTTGPNIASSQHHNTTNRPRLQHAQSMPSVIQNRRSSRKKRRCSVM